MDHDYDEDAAIEAAIAASLETQDASTTTAPKQTNSLVDLTGDSDEEKAASFQRHDTTPDPNPRAAVRQTECERPSNIDLSTNADRSEIPETSAPVYGILGIDRRKQEQERLARLSKKRGAESLSPSNSLSRGKIPKSEPDSPKRASPGAQIESSLAPSPPVPGLEYPRGTVKKTWVFGCQRENDIKIEEVLQKSDLELAILSSFQWNMEWLFKKVDTKKSRFYLVIGAKEESEKRNLQEDFKGISQVRLCLPPMEEQVNCMHSKLMLLFHPNHLRIVLPSANLVPYDWGEEGGFMENIVFLIDLPRKSSESLKGEEEFETTFLKELKYFMKSSGMEDNIIAKLSRFDFKNTADIAFVHTIGGSHFGDSWKRTGHCGLGRAVSQLGLTTSKAVNLDYITSSVGSLNEQFMRSMYFAAQGDSGLKELTLRTSKKFPSDKWGATVNASDGKEWKDNFTLYFPSLQTVKESKGEAQGAGTICFQSKWYNANTFPSHAMKDNVSTRDGLLMHNKMLFVRPNEDIRHPRDQDLICRGWVYVGSANLSESAWGRFVVDRTTKQPKLNCRNWESGVLVPVYSPIQSQDGSKKNGSSGFREVFDAHIPVPMQVPAPSYSSRQTRPWYFMEDY